MSAFDWALVIFIVIVVIISAVGIYKALKD